MKYGVESGIIDIAYLQNVVAMQKREEFLKKHPYKIWQSKDGKTWKTYIPDGKNGRKQI
ncbi:MAG: site-specific integrase, partial [Lachnospiraceae bacterium]|nr:site-specific integrase [Lachnospiraceae bacterium]